MMEIQRVSTGIPASYTSARPLKDETKTAGQTSVDRVEQSRQWVEQMEDQRKQLLALMSQPAGQNKAKKSDGLLGMLDELNSANEEVDAMARQLKMRMKCMEIARRIMQGKKVPLKDERYLMENDPKGYQLAMAMRKPPKKDEKECKSVLDDEDEESKTSDSGEAAPMEVSAEGGEIAASDSGETTE